MLSLRTRITVVVIFIARVRPTFGINFTFSVSITTLFF